MDNQNTIEGDLKAAIAEAVESGWSYNRLARETGVPVPTLTRWVLEERGITLESAQKLCDWLGCRLTKIRSIPRPE